MAVLLLCAAFLGACAKEKPGVTWEQDKATVTGDIEANRSASERNSASVEQNSARLDALDDEKISKRLRDLETVNRAQQAQIDALMARIETVRRTGAPTVNPQAVPLHRTTPVKPSATPPVSSSDSVADRSAQAEAEKNAYTAAYLALKSGRFEEASSGFNDQLDAFPDGEYADQAWYWLGEARLAQRLPENALNAFKYVADHFPESVKHAAALLKLGQLSEAAKETGTAIAYYERVISEHPQNALADQARAALNDLRQADGAGAEKEQ